jgi:hypothetical protein
VACHINFKDQQHFWNNNAYPNHYQVIFQSSGKSLEKVLAKFEEIWKKKSAEKKSTWQHELIFSTQSFVFPAFLSWEIRFRQFSLGFVIKHWI